MPGEVHAVRPLHAANPGTLANEMAQQACRAAILDAGRPPLTPRSGHSAVLARRCPWPLLVLAAACAGRCFCWPLLVLAARLASARRSTPARGALAVSLIVSPPRGPVASMLPSIASIGHVVHGSGGGGCCSWPGWRGGSRRPRPFCLRLLAPRAWSLDSVLRDPAVEGCARARERCLACFRGSPQTQTSSIAFSMGVPHAADARRDDHHARGS